mmetsp:Transcript_3027/g.3686  ORF Transcript_3027/g.3686 Transcript_3027/m.3686 type:complete len:452 (+) Transcript_3027:74-1429(+)
MDDDAKNDLSGESRFELKRVRANTLQGRIYDALDKLTDKPVVVKETWKQLVTLKVSRDGHPVPEDFMEEKKMMNYLSKMPDANDYNFVKLIDEWEDGDCYFYAMDACLGGELFDYVKKMHSDGAMKHFAIKQAGLHQHTMKRTNSWIRAVTAIWTQCVKTVWWFHQRRVVHLDLSLENTMIASRRDGSIKIIDFGLAKTQIPNNSQWKMKGRVGKLGYMAPEVFNKQEFDPRLADVWSLGVMLFMMLVGAPPYDLPKMSNTAFKYIMNGRLSDILKHWKRLRLLTDDALDMLERIFKPENKRITMDEILDHDFVKLKSWRLDWLNAQKMNENSNDYKLHDQTTSESENTETEIKKMIFTTPIAINYKKEIESAASDITKLKQILIKVENNYNDEVKKIQNDPNGSVNNQPKYNELDNVQKLIKFKIEQIDEQPGSSLVPNNRKTKPTSYNN